MTERASSALAAERQRPSVTVADAAEYLGVSKTTVRRWTDAGAIRHVRTPGGQRRFRLVDLDAFLASLEPR